MIPLSSCLLVIRHRCITHSLPFLWSDCSKWLKPSQALSPDAKLLYSPAESTSWAMWLAVCRDHTLPAAYWFSCLHKSTWSGWVLSLLTFGVFSGVLFFVFSRGCLHVIQKRSCDREGDFPQSLLQMMLTSLTDLTDLFLFVFVVELKWRQSA